MRYKLIAEVEGNIFIPEDVSVEFQSVIVEFLRNDDGKLTRISVSKPVPDTKLNNFKQSFEPGFGNVKLNISIGGDKELHNDLIKELQTVESNLAFASKGSLNHIRWDKPQQEYIPENTEEDDRIAVRNFSASKKYPEQKVNVTPKALIGLVNLSQNYESLLLAKAFWREGMVYYKNFQYIQAFYHFYFVLEDFYISGKSSSKKSVMKKLQESRELQDIANSALHQTQNLSGHKTKLQKFLLEYSCANTASGLLEMLYEIRNHLHHFHSKSTKIQGTPFNQSNFDTIALAMMHIVTLAISYREVKITQSLKTAKAS